jgi:hypothetical protein
MNKSAFELLKNSVDTNVLEWLKAMPFISFGVVTQVIDLNTVLVKEVVQTSLSEKTYTVQLFYPSSKLKEESVYPNVFDLVLLLFLNKRNPLMFFDPVARNEATGKPTITDKEAVGYNQFSGIGILMSVAKGVSATTVRYDEDERGPTITSRTIARITAAFSKALSITFNNPRMDKDTAPDDEEINVDFEAHSPFVERHKASVTRSFGVDELPDHTFAELQAPVSEEYGPGAPITRSVQGTDTSSHGLRVNSEGEKTETDAPVSETIHGKAPVTKDIRSPQTHRIGIGNDETGSADEQRDAAVDVTMGEKANITLDSKSGMTLKFAKAVLLKIEDSYGLQVSGPITIQSDDAVVIKAQSDVTVQTSGNAEVEATGNVDVKGVNVTVEASTLLTLKTGDASALMPNVMPVCPLGPVHGGPLAGILKLKGA